MLLFYADVQRSLYSVGLWRCELAEFMDFPTVNIEI